MNKLRSRLKINCATCSVHSLCFANNIDQLAMQDLNTIITQIKKTKKGSHVFYAQDKMRYLYALYSGSCKTYWVDQDGNERIENFYLPGDIIGLESLSKQLYLFSLVTLEDSMLCIVPIDDLFILMQKNKTFLKRMMYISSNKMQNDLYVSISTNAPQRVADFMLNIYYRMQERRVNSRFIFLPMSQLDISYFLGMAHETVNRIIRNFIKNKIIKVYNKKIYILDAEQLKAISMPPIPKQHKSILS